MAIFDDVQPTPDDKDRLDQATAFHYTTTVPSFTPRYSGYKTTYFDGTDYWLYVYVNGGWRTFKAGTSGIYGRAHAGSNQSINDITLTKVAFDSASFTASGITFSGANNRFTVVTAGQYRVSANLTYASPVDTALYQALIYLNNSEYSRSGVMASGTAGISTTVTDILNLAVNDYVEIFAYHNSGAARNVSGGSNLTYFAIESL